MLFGAGFWFVLSSCYLLLAVFAILVEPFAISQLASAARAARAAASPGQCCGFQSG